MAETEINRVYVGTVSAKGKYTIRLEVDKAKRELWVHLRRVGHTDKHLRLAASDLAPFLSSAWTVLDKWNLRNALGQTHLKKYVAGDGKIAVRLSRPHFDDQFYAAFSLWSRRSRLRIDRFVTLVNIVRRAAETMGVDVSEPMREHLLQGVRQLEVVEGIDRSKWVQIDEKL